MKRHARGLPSRLGIAATLLAALVIAAACGSSAPSTSPTTGSSQAPSSGMSSAAAQSPAVTSGGASQSPAAVGSGPATTPICSADKSCKVALVISDAGLGDKGFNDLANAGMQKAVKEFPGVTGTPIQDPQIDTHGLQDLTQAAQAGYGLVIDLDYGTLDNLNQVAKKFPKTSFVFVDGVATGPNVTSAIFNVQDSSYLCGMLAGMAVDNPAVNKTGKKIIGTVGGAKSPGIDQFLVGYQQGAQAIDPAIKVLVSYANNFADPTIGANLANAMYDQGALVVYQVAGVTGLGVIKSAQQRDRYAIGVDSNQDGVAPGHVLTSSIKRTDTAVYDIIKDYAGGTLAGGKSIYYGLPDGVGITDLTYTKSLFSVADLAKVQQTEKSIESGALKVWNVPTQGYPSWFGKSGS